VVPQRLRDTAGDDGLDLFLRANMVFGRSRLEVRCSGNLLKRVKRLRLNPGEMERVRLNRDAVRRIDGADLAVEALEAEG
jgi:hypothetical protein